MQILRRTVSGIVAAFSLAACGTTAVVTDISQDKVRMVVSGNDAAFIQAKVNEACGVYKRDPVPISYRCLDLYCIETEYLWACKPRG